MGEYEIEHLFYKVQASDSKQDNSLDELRSLIISYNNYEIHFQCLKLIKLLDLGTFEKGLISFDKKLNRSSSYSSELRKKKIQLMYDKKSNTSCDDKDDIYIERNTLVALKCTRV